MVRCARRESTMTAVTTDQNLAAAPRNGIDIHCGTFVAHGLVRAVSTLVSRPGLHRGGRYSRNANLKKDASRRNQSPAIHTARSLRRNAQPRDDSRTRPGVACLV